MDIVYLNRLAEKHGVVNDALMQMAELSISFSNYNYVDETTVLFEGCSDLPEELPEYMQKCELKKETIVINLDFEESEEEEIISFYSDQEIRDFLQTHCFVAEPTLKFKTPDAILWNCVYVEQFEEYYFYMDKPDAYIVGVFGKIEHICSIIDPVEESISGENHWNIVKKKV